MSTVLPMTNWVVISDSRVVVMVMPGDCGAVKEKVSMSSLCSSFLFSQCSRLMISKFFNFLTDERK